MVKWKFDIYTYAFCLLMFSGQFYEKWIPFRERSITLLLETVRNIASLETVTCIIATLKFKCKTWITLGLQKSISVKNKLLTNFINKKDPILKEEFHTNYKKYRNLLSTLMKKSK